MRKLQVPTFPASSVAVTFTALSPIGNSSPDWLLDCTLISAFGSTWIELSVTWMLHITFAVGFPLSVLVSRVGPGQFRRGGSTSTRRFYTKNVTKKITKSSNYFFPTRLWKCPKIKVYRGLESELKSSMSKLVNFPVKAWRLQNSREV